jgi:hypothetical protein
VGFEGTDEEMLGSDSEKQEARKALPVAACSAKILLMREE